jgi:hypothetical protein
MIDASQPGEPESAGEEFGGKWIAWDEENLHIVASGATTEEAKQHAQFVTFYCFRRRRLLDHPRMRDDFVRITAEKLGEHRGICCGFVAMPDHVHANVWFAAAGNLYGASKAR